MFRYTLITLTTLASLLASSTVSADMLQISNPTQGTVWKVGEIVFLQWSGNCASMGTTAAHQVDVNLMTGDPSALRFVAKLAEIDCSGSNTRKEFVIPADVVRESGKYSLSVQTAPALSYSNVFTIDMGGKPAAGAGSGAAPGTGSSPTNSNYPPANPAGEPKDQSAATTLKAHAAGWAVAGIALLATQLL
ncbi:hypothetical protein BGW42_005283 [Actinomortierella wolfii]|nr:hypothetical protein BGW42_005283 [Actinomortierella wolfii]KAG0235931.1 hypothetical protein BGW41_000622 [Actinomortierella wolfii]